MGARRDQMRVQNGLKDRLQPSPLPDDLVTPRHLSAQCQRRLVRYPDFRQEATRIQSGEDRRIDDVGLDSRFSD